VEQRCCDPLATSKPTPPPTAYTYLQVHTLLISVGGEFGGGEGGGGKGGGGVGGGGAGGGEGSVEGGVDGGVEGGSGGTEGGCLGARPGENSGIVGGDGGVGGGGDGGGEGGTDGGGGKGGGYGGKMDLMVSEKAPSPSAEAAPATCIAQCTMQTHKVKYEQALVCLSNKYKSTRADVDQFIAK